MKPVVRVENVLKRFRKQPALAGVTFDILPGTVFALLGENGAGKTTLIRILLGLLRPDSGQTEVLGMDSQTHAMEIRRRVGYVPDRPALYEWMTVQEIGWFAAGFHPDGFQQRFVDLARQYELPLGRTIQDLSKGMQAKVSLALALASNPEILILDEPTSGLDPRVRREFLDSVVELATEGRTVLLSSHQIDEVERVADQVAILNDGKLDVLDTVENLLGQVSDVTVTLSEPNWELPPFPGRILSERRESRQWQGLVHQANVTSLEDHPAVREVQVHTPKLVDVFLAYLKRNPTQRKFEEAQR